MKKYKPEDLIHNYANDTASEEERIIVESWHIYELKESKYRPSQEHITIVHNRTWEKLSLHMHHRENTLVNKKLWVGVAAAAAILLISSIITYSYLKPASLSSPVLMTQNDVMAAENKATLTLNNGERISLNQSNKDLVAIQGGINIRKSNGLLIYEQQKSTTATIALNKLETPRGGKYQVLLPDGTKVWLNSASILTYPNTFIGKDRIVSLLGEAYFEVAKHKEKVFKVVSGTQTIEVLGTHFNVKSYTDENETQTTLAEGKVKISKGLKHIILKPGQAAFTSENSKSIKIKKTDLEKDLAWKNNEFIFRGDDIMSIMREVARWYNVEVTYEGNFNKDGYMGTISRSKNISEVLKMLQLTGKINYKIEGRRITLMK
ncbi:FecR family protein [Pedobacter gandavensis]|uniref:FecR family protein n=1 Tax=Pedobacter gandavensis TaxID=2679963 RepID=UPI00292EBCDE|nr:FecR family protein [Pedobacter gandavensis]